MSICDEITILGTSIRGMHDCNMTVQGGARELITTLSRDDNIIYRCFEGKSESYIHSV